MRFLGIHRVNKKIMSRIASASYVEGVGEIIAKDRILVPPPIRGRGTLFGWERVLRDSVCKKRVCDDILIISLHNEAGSY